MDLDDLELEGNAGLGPQDVVSAEVNLINPFAWDGPAKGSYLGLVVVDASHPREYPIIGDIEVGSPAAGQDIAIGDKLMAGNGQFFIGMSAEMVYDACTTELPQVVRLKIIRADEMLNHAGLDDDDSLAGEAQGNVMARASMFGDFAAASSPVVGTRRKSPEFVEEYETKLDEEERYTGKLMKGLFRADPIDIDRSRPRDWVYTDACGRNSHIKCLLLTLLPIMFAGIGTVFDRRTDPIYQADSRFLQHNIEGLDISYFGASQEDDDYNWLQVIKNERGVHKNDTWAPAIDIFNRVKHYKCYRKSNGARCAGGNRNECLCEHPPGKLDGYRIDCLGNTLTEWGFGDYCYEWDEQALFCYGVATFIALWYCWDTFFSQTRERLRELDSLVKSGVPIIKAAAAKDYWNNMTSIGVPMFIWDLKAMHTEKRRGKKVNVITHRANKFYHVDGWLDGTEPNAKIHYPNRPSRFPLTKMTFKQFFQWRTAEEETRHNTALQKWVEDHGKDVHAQATSVYHHPDFEPVLLVGSRSIFANVYVYWFFSLIWLSWPYRMWIERHYGNLWRNFVKTSSHVPFLHQVKALEEVEKVLKSGALDADGQDGPPKKKIFDVGDFGSMKRGFSTGKMGARGSNFDEPTAPQDGEFENPLFEDSNVANPLFHDDDADGAAYAIGTEGYVEQVPPAPDTQYLDNAPDPEPGSSKYNTIDEHDLGPMLVGEDGMPSGAVGEALHGMGVSVDAISVARGQSIANPLFGLPEEDATSVATVESAGYGFQDDNVSQNTVNTIGTTFGMAVDEGDRIESNNPLFGMNIDEASPFGAGEEATGFGGVEGVNWEAWGAMAGGDEEEAAPNYFLNEIVSGFDDEEDVEGFGDQAMAF